MPDDTIQQDEPTQDIPPEPKPAESTQSPQQPEPKIIEKEVIKEVKVIDEEEVKKQVDEKLKEKILENKKKANEARIQRKKNNLDKIVELAKKKEINNQDVRDLLQVSQSTATNYLTKLAKSGRLKAEKKAKAKVYRS